MRSFAWGPGLILVAASLSIAMTPAEASANTCSISCTYGTKCSITCDDDDQYVIFGKIRYDGSDVGYGVCYFDTDGSHGKSTFQGYAASTTFAPKYVVELAGADDVARVGDTSGYEYCGTDANNKTVEVYGYLPSVNYQYEFSGGTGVDHLYLNMLGTDTEPTTGQSINAAGSLLGGDGNDLLFGSAYNDYLYGEGDADTINPRSTGARSRGGRVPRPSWTPSGPAGRNPRSRSRR